MDKQLPIPFPGEADHTSRLLQTAAFLIGQRRFRAAYDVLELAERGSRTDEETAELRALYGLLALSADREARVHRAAAHPEPRLARVLSFATRSSPARASLETASAS